MEITITLNGKPLSAGNTSNVLQLLNYYSINPLHVVVEINQNIIDKTCYETHMLHDGDIVEILHFVGGG